MPTYVDGFITPVPKKNLAKYKKASRKMGKLMKKLGALEYVEYIADDVKPGKWTSFPRSVKKKPSETVFFSYVTYKSKAQRDSIGKKMMKNPITQDPDMMPFDGKRMIYGGFKSFVEM